MVRKGKQGRLIALLTIKVEIIRIQKYGGGLVVRVMLKGKN